MVKFIPVQYRDGPYPDGIDPVLNETPAHLDTKEARGTFVVQSGAYCISGRMSGVRGNGGAGVRYGFSKL